MPVLAVSDAADSLLDDYLRLTDVALRSRIEQGAGLYMAESTQVIARALAAGHRPRSVLVPEKWLADVSALLARYDLDVPVLVGPAAIVESITGFHLHRGALAAMNRPALPPLAHVLEGARRLAVIENVVDHTNVGALFRSCAALGVDAVLVTPSCADPLYRRSVRVSMGTVFQVPWTRIDPWPGSIAALQAAGFVVAGMTLGEGAISLAELVAENHPQLALVFGTEGQGLLAATERCLDRRVTIAMKHGVDSLNVAASAAVAFYALG